MTVKIHGNDTHHSALLVLIALSLACSGGSSPSSREEAERISAPITATCPAGNGLFVLYYGSSNSAIARIRAARPNFVVVANTDAQWPDKYHFDDPAGQTGPTGIKVIAYIATDYGDLDVSLKIDAAMAAGYDGIFFDEVSPDVDDVAYNTANYQRTKGFGSGKLVIANPGRVSGVARVFEAADIVSVENKYDEPLDPTFPAWRWLAVQGDPASVAAPDAATADGRLATFRNSSGGFWYYSPERSTERPATHILLPPWFEEFAALARARGDVTCSTPRPTLEVRAADLDHGGAPLSGLCVFIDGATSCSGFTPLRTTLSPGNHTVAVADFAANRFDHWDNGSTTRTRTVTITADAQVTAHYHTTTNPR
jgi:hypothetical protein